MIGKTNKTPQLNIYQVPLLQFINKGHELCQLAEKIDWDAMRVILLNVNVLTTVDHRYPSEKLWE